ncbi:MAG TPA: M48 family peptidase [Firmicutes bacterium]|nr:M48 family peptidase [Bacillota bacterium]
MVQEILSIGNYEVKIERKKIKNIYLKVKRNGDILLTAHPNVELSYLEQFVQSKAKWILQKKMAMEQRKIEANQHCSESEQFITVLGMKLMPLTIKATCSNIVVQPPYLKQYVLPNTTETTARKQLETWLQYQLDDKIKEYIKKYWPYFSERGIGPVEVKYRKMNATWGVCRPVSRTITFNKHLIACDPEFVEFVVVHELCHLIHANHGQHFYALLQHLLPQWKAYSKRH